MPSTSYFGSCIRNVNRMPHSTQLVDRVRHIVLRAVDLKIWPFPTRHGISPLMAFSSYTEIIASVNRRESTEMTLRYIGVNLGDQCRAFEAVRNLRVQMQETQEIVPFATVPDV